MRTPLASLRRGLRAAVPVLALGTAALTAVLAACADSPTSPAASPAAAAVRARFANPFRDMSGAGTDTTRATLSIDPRTRTTWGFNGNTVALAPGAICDPASSGYGPDRWDAPCQAATQPVTVQVKAWMLPNGQPAATFTPDLRFVPGTVNTLTLTPRAASAGPIVWCPTNSTVCVDESESDPSLTTTRNSDGTVTRRIKHFSGYSVLVN